MGTSCSATTVDLAGCSGLPAFQEDWSTVADASSTPTKPKGISSSQRGEDEDFSPLRLEAARARTLSAPSLPPPAALHQSARLGRAAALAAAASATPDAAAGPPSCTAIQDMVVQVGRGLDAQEAQEVYRSIAMVLGMIAQSPFEPAFRTVDKAGSDCMCGAILSGNVAAEALLEALGFCDTGDGFLVFPLCGDLQTLRLALKLAQEALRRASDVSEMVEDSSDVDSEEARGSDAGSGFGSLCRAKADEESAGDVGEADAADAGGGWQASSPASRAVSTEEKPTPQLAISEEEAPAQASTEEKPPPDEKPTPLEISEVSPEETPTQLEVFRSADALQPPEEKPTPDEEPVLQAGSETSLQPGPQQGHPLDRDALWCRQLLYSSVAPTLTQEDGFIQTLK